jgi:isoleucyl-tRNA synthetase
LDVWFDSGMSHAAVVEPNPELPWPADMYLEGSDQHRGWFHSSLLESVGTRGTAPYKNVLTHGYVVDGDGRKMSKSLGNVVAPQDIIKKYGAEILRLWVSYEDYRNDISISNEMLKHLADAYRRIRNTCKYLLGSIYDYDPARDAVPYDELLDMDKWILHRTQELVARVRKAYEDFEFHTFFHAFHNFCVVEMSAFYMDVLKDRMYTSKADSKERRSGQTAMYIVLDTMIKLMAPILSFTAEEVWQHLSKSDRSIHLEEMPEVNPAWMDEDLDESWSRMIEVRGEILKRLEIARTEKMIGHSLDALVQVFTAGSTYELIEQFEDQLASICIVSEAELFGEEVPIPDDAVASEIIEHLNIRVSKAYGEKCPRCWQFRTTIGEDPAHPDICAKCAAALS